MIAQYCITRLEMPTLEDDDAYEKFSRSGNIFHLWDQMQHDMFEIASRHVHSIARIVAEKGPKEIRRESVLLFPE